MRNFIILSTNAFEKGKRYYKGELTAKGRNVKTFICNKILKKKVIFNNEQTGKVMELPLKKITIPLSTYSDIAESLEFAEYRRQPYITADCLITDDLILEYNYLKEKELGNEQE